MPDPRFRRHPRVAWAREEGRWYLARVPSGPIHCLEGPAALIWDELLTSADGTAAAADLAERVSLRAEAELDVVRVDVDDFLTRLVALGLLEPLSPEPR